ncbi:MAG: hypothetical protein EOM92_16205, partial [Gammaproteobacteria bacterium]|nr:hypothetical protein [Gammaproteobacteria bacterium]
MDLERLLVPASIPASGGQLPLPPPGPRIPVAVAGRTVLSLWRGAPLHHRFPLLIAWAGMTLGYGMVQSLSAAVFDVRPGTAA